MITPQSAVYLVSLWKMRTVIYFPKTRKNKKRKEIQNLENERNISISRRMMKKNMREIQNLKNVVCRKSAGTEHSH